MWGGKIYDVLVYSGGALLDDTMIQINEQFHMNENGVDFDSQMLYEQSVDLERLTDIQDYIQTDKNKPITDAILLSKENSVVSMELIESYEYYLKQNIGEEEREETEKEIKELKGYIRSYQKAIDILEDRSEIEWMKK